MGALVAQLGLLGALACSAAATREETSVSAPDASAVSTLKPEQSLLSTRAPDTEHIASESPAAESTDVEAAADGPQSLMAAALTGAFEGESIAIEAMGDSGDPSYIAVLADILRFPWLLTPKTEKAVLRSLGTLSGQPDDELSEDQLVSSWWVEWLGHRPEIRSPQGYAEWKGSLLSRAQSLSFIPASGFGHEGLGELDYGDVGDFLYDGVKTRIRIEEIVWGGVPKDGIPDLIRPAVLPAAEATYLIPSDRVFGLSVQGEHRAYPLRILNSHEMVNDLLGGVPIVLTY